MKKIFWLLAVLVFFSGCSKKEENSFIDLGPDDYFVCSYEASYQTEKASSDCEAVLLNHDGKVIAEFPGGYVSGIITKDGYMTGKKNGVVSKDDTLILFFQTDDGGGYRTGVYKIGEEQWLIEPEEGESQIIGIGLDTTGRLKNFSIGKQEYDRSFEKIPNSEAAKIC